MSVVRKSSDELNRFPQEVIAALREHIANYKGPGQLVIVKGDSRPFQFGDKVVIPAMGWDFEERVAELVTVNLRQLRVGDLFGGPTIMVYEKINPAVSGWILFALMQNGESSNFQVLEFK